jgi:hypothetical protein
MEHSFVQPIEDLAGGDPDPIVPAQVDPIPEKLYDAIDDLQDTIYAYKKKLYSNHVSANEKQQPNTILELNRFHSLFLQILGFWIGVLDDVPASTPTFSGPTQQADEKKWKAITKTLLTLADTSQDARTLVQSLLFQLSVQHPYDFGNKFSDSRREDAEDTDL